MFKWNLFSKQIPAAQEAKAAEPDPETRLSAIEERIHKAGGELSGQLRGLAVEFDKARNELTEAEKIQSPMNWVVWELESVCKKLEEVESIGVWFRSDDSSDNRNRRSGLREASSDCYAACQNLDKLQAMVPRKEFPISPLIAEIEELKISLDALADSVLDTMGENTPFRSNVSSLHVRAEGIYNQVLPFAEECRAKVSQTKARVDSLEMKRRTLLEGQDETAI